MIAALALLTSAYGIDAMRHERRVLLISAPAGDARLARQDALLAADKRRLDDRDVTVVRVAGDAVSGVAEPARALRRRWRLGPATFAVVLIGKDGHVSLRRAEPLSGDALVAAIDAMPMRRAGLR